MKWITVKQLKRIGACSGGIARFLEVFPSGRAPLTVASYRKMRSKIWPYDYLAVLADLMGEDAYMGIRYRVPYPNTIDYDSRIKACIRKLQRMKRPARLSSERVRVHLINEQRYEGASLTRFAVRRGRR